MLLTSGTLCELWKVPSVLDWGTLQVTVVTVTAMMAADWYSAQKDASAAGMYVNIHGSLHGRKTANTKTNDTIHTHKQYRNLLENHQQISY